jgi:hypothetical protein
MEYMGLMIGVFIAAVVINLGLAFVDLKIQRDMGLMLEDLINGYIEDSIEQGVMEQTPVLKLSKDQMNSIAQLVVDTMEIKKKEK